MTLCDSEVQDLKLRQTTTRAREEGEVKKPSVEMFFPIYILL